MNFVLIQKSASKTYRFFLSAVLLTKVGGNSVVGRIATKYKNFIKLRMDENGV
jgi:hypothetical protein